MNQALSHLQFYEFAEFAFIIELCVMMLMVVEDGEVESEGRCRVQAGANAWRKVDGVMLYRKMLK